MRNSKKIYPLPSLDMGLYVDVYDGQTNLVFICFYPTALKGCQGIVFSHGVRMGRRSGGRAAGKSLSRLYLGNCKV